jgi:hypothetical protein
MSAWPEPVSFCDALPVIQDEGGPARSLWQHSQMPYSG